MVQVMESPLGARQFVVPKVPLSPLPLMDTFPAVGGEPLPDHVSCALTVTAAVDPYATCDGLTLVTLIALAAWFTVWFVIPDSPPYGWHRRSRLR